MSEIIKCGVPLCERPALVCANHFGSANDIIADLRNELAAANLERNAQRGVIAAELRKRADWLRTQSDKGYYVIPSAKADECIWLAEKIEKGLTP